MAIIDNEKKIQLRKTEFNKVRIQQILEKWTEFSANAVKYGEVPVEKLINIKIRDNILIIYGLPVVLKIDINECEFDFDETGSHVVSLKPKNSAYDEILIYRLSS